MALDFPKKLAALLCPKEIEGKSSGENNAAKYKKEDVLYCFKKAMQAHKNVTINFLQRNKTAQFTPKEKRLYNCRILSCMT